MVTEELVKKNTEIKDFDTLNVKEWAGKKLQLNPSAKTSLKHCYEAYKNYLESDKKVVPLTKKSFSGLLRDLLKEDENNGKVRFYQRSYILIKGVQIKGDEIVE
jgi:phage/plasmid-associated DNA primase